MEIDWERAIEFPTGRSNYVGWIKVQKRSPSPRMLELFQNDPNHQSITVREKRALEFPFDVRVIELDRSVYESSRYETNEDFRRQERHLFETEDEVGEFLERFGYALEELKPLHQVGYP